jgi:16S rRNA (guanine966-N2)-methyltransferase
MTGVRITGGAMRGRRLNVRAGNAIRPTSDKARQAFFNIVGPSIAGARFLDLFSGSGIFSFEAVSRGAERAIAVDSSRRATESIACLAAEWGAPIESRTADAITAVRHGWPEPFDLVYADPPYDFPRYADLVVAIDRDLPLSAGAIIAIEHRCGSSLDVRGLSRLSFRRTAEYGNVAISLFDVVSTPSE